MSWVDAELVLVSLAAMLSPTTLTFSVLTLVLGDRPLEPEKVDAMVARMSKVTASPTIAVIGAGAVLANPGAFIPIALKTISETDPSTAEYMADWALFTFVSLLPLSIALFLLVLAPHRARRLLARTRDWLIAHARTVAAVILVLLAATLLRNGIAGLT